MPLPPPVLTISPLTADFGSVTEGETSSSMSFTVTNTGGSDSGAISAMFLGSGAANFNIESNNCTVLAANATCTIAVSFSPATAGPKQANLSVSATPGGSVSAALDGTGVPIGDISISPSSHAFGNVVVGATSATAATFTITNTGGTTTGTLNVTTLGADANDFDVDTDTCNNMTLAASATCMITVNFAPTSMGAKSASLTVTATNGPGGSVSAAMTGTGLEGARLAINPTLIDFGSPVVGQPSTNQTFTVTNVGGVASGSVTPTLSGADAANWSIVSGNCAAPLNPNASCNVTLRFTPSSAGPKAAQLDVNATPGGAANATLTGNGVEPGALAIAPTSHTFDNTTVGATSASQTFTITNTGGAPTGALSTALGGVDPNHFTIVAGSNGCQGTVIPAGGNCTIVITFTPSSGGPKSANITVTGSPGGVVSAGLGGLAIPDAQLTLTPASFDYGSVGTGTQTAFQTFTVTNTGGQVSGAVNVALNGPNATQFIMVDGCMMQTLDPTETCTVQVRFAPNINGTAVASLDVSGSPGGSDSSGLFGQGVPPAQIQVMPGALEFDNGNGPDGEVLLGESSQLTFTVRNNGTEPTGTINVTVTGTHAGDYTTTDTCTTLPAGMSCLVTVTFTPSARGTRSASVNVAATPGGEVAVSLTGDSLPRLELLLPATNPFIFADTVINTSAPPATVVRVRNNTRMNQNLTLSTNPSFGSNDTASFQFAGGGCVGGTTLGPDDTCDAIVQFEPDTTGLKTGTMTFSISGGGPFNTAVQTLEGTGVDSLIITAQTVTNFGPVAQGTASASLVFIVTNPANSPTSGPIGTTIDNAAFQIIGNTCAGDTLGPTETCTITVKYLPTVGGGMVQTANLTVTAVPGGQDSIAISGTAVNQAALTLNPAATLAFGNVFSGENRILPIVVSNPAGAAISGPVQYSIAGGDSGLYTFVTGAGSDCVNGTTTLAAGQSCNIRIRFSPIGTSFGAKNDAEVTISANPGTTAPREVALTGTSVSTIGVTPAAHDYGDRTVGTTVSQTFNVRNNSNNAVMISSTTPPVGSTFTITSNNCTGSLASMAQCMVTVRFAPASVGDFDAFFTVNSMNGLATADLAGHGNSAPDVSWEETFSAGSPFDYGTTLAGEQGLSRTFTLRNLGEEPAPAINAIVTSDALQYTVTSTNCTGLVLAPNATCTATIRFNPGPSGAPTADVTATVVAMGTTGTNATINLIGRRVASGALTYNPTFLSYNNVVSGIGTAGQTQNVTVLNTSGNAVTFDAAVTTTRLANTPSSHFTITATTCGGTLVAGIVVDANVAAGSQCIITVRFNPTAVGTFTHYLFTDAGINDVSASPVAPLTGRGLAPASVAVSDTSPDFPAGTALTSFSEVAITFTNSGEVPTGVPSQSAIMGADAAMFTKSGCTAAIPAMGQCVLTVRFTPANVGPKSASFTIGMNPGLATQTITLNATGVTNATIGLTPTEQQDAGSRANGALDPGGTVYTVTNGGDVATGNLSVALTNTNFEVDPGFGTCNFGAPLAGNSNCTFRVKFNPKQVGDNLTTTVTVSANPGMSAAGSIIGDALTAMSATPTSQAFGTVADGGTSSAFTITFENRAAVPTGLVYTSLIGTNATDFTLAGAMADDCAGKVLNPFGMAGDSCTVTIRFTPAPGSPSGPKSATLRVQSTPGDTVNVSLTGTSN